MPEVYKLILGGYSHLHYWRERLQTPSVPFSITRRDLAVTATTLFVDVSEKHPASVAAQAALIATKCRTSEANCHQPTLLKFALLSDIKMVERLCKTAQARHRASPSEEAPTFIDYETMFSFINADFSWAARMRVLNMDELNTIYTIGYQQFGSSSSKVKEHLRLIDGLIRSKTPI